jgi:hypothetical protein
VAKQTASTSDPNITVCVPAAWLARDDELTLLMNDIEDVRPFGKPTRSMIARPALQRGLGPLERQYNETPAAKRARRG